MENICRICVSYNTEMISLLQDTFSDELGYYGQKYEDLFGIKVLDIPSYIDICIKCKDKLENFHLFKEEAIKSHIYLINKCTEFIEISDDIETQIKNNILHKHGSSNGTEFFEKTTEHYNDSEEKSLQVSSLENFHEVKSEFISYTDDKCVKNKYFDEGKEDPFDELSLSGCEEIFEVKVFNGEESRKELTYDVNNGEEKMKKELEEDFDTEENICDNSLEFILESSQENYQCDICHRFFLNEKIYKFHLEFHNNLSRSRKRSKHKDDNDANIVDQKTKKPKRKYKKSDFSDQKEKYKCDECKRNFAIEERYNAHLNIHKGLPPYSCSTCGKGFKNLTNYTYHMKNHKGERSFVCEICSKAFIVKWDLLIHMRCHRDERPYVCETCGKQFRMLSHLTYHRDSHQEGIKYECDICHKLLRTRNSLRNHMKDIHLSRRFSCEACNKEFSRKQYFRMHVERYHNDLTEQLFPKEKQKLHRLRRI